MPATGVDKAVRQRGSANELPQHLENDFDRQAFVPRLLVLAMLAAATLLEYGHGHWEGHWIVLVIYGLTTVVLALSSRFAAGQSWLPWVATVTDAGLVVYVTADHLPRDTHDLALATDAVSLFPAFLLLIQTGLRLRRDLVAAYAGIVAAGWLAALSMIADSGTFAAAGPSPLATRQVLGLLLFVTTAGFVFYAVHRMRLAWATILRVQWDRMLLSHFLPEGIAAEVVNGEAEIAERHVCLLAVDIRGFSALVRERPRREVIGTLMEFRRLVHDSVSHHGGIVDKYLGDGVLAVFLHDTPEQQAESALAAALDILRQVDGWKEHVHAPSGVRAIAALHRGLVFAGVFDDDRRAEFTVLGPAMNALSRMERRAKEAGVDLLVSKGFLRLLQPSTRAGLNMQPVGRRAGDEELPDVLSVHPVGAAAVSQPRLAAVPDSQVAIGRPVCRDGGQ
ncbi:adenylate/guanylate cyclase domain-containing protein [Microvirga sp. Mcv34]|uniref:adenylate/guanylate cyclase domain-containing protein n=1 Tax=Microvirga sp. Mcv34 TaxID=2926016 RepID=UPI0021C80842|nr:adenylate/guanylate cyclase domain-containing protein [Microvirga sp. Mcv34]